MVIAAQNKLHTMTTDIANALCSYGTLYGEICSIAGKEFKERQGSKVSILNGTKTASQSIHEFLGTLMIQMGFQPWQAEQDLWWKISKDYNYIATHVLDGVISYGRDPSQHISLI